MSALEEAYYVKVTRDSGAKKRTSDDIHVADDDETPPDTKRIAVSKDQAVIKLQGSGKEHVVHLHLHVDADAKQPIKIELMDGIVGNVTTEHNKAPDAVEGSKNIFSRLKSTTMTIVNGIVMDQFIVNDSGGPPIINRGQISLTINGPVGGSVKTLSGNINCSRIGGGVNTSSGSVHCTGDICSYAKTMSGDITCDGSVTGDVKTMSGDVKVGLEVRGKVSTMSGSIRSGRK